MKIIERFEDILKEYCKQNNFDYEKLVSLPRCGNESMLFIQHYDPKEAINGMIDKTPAEIVLSVRIDKNGTVNIESGKNANKYLYV